MTWTTVDDLMSDPGDRHRRRRWGDDDGDLASTTDWTGATTRPHDLDDRRDDWATFSIVGDDILARFAPWVRHKFTGLDPGDEKWKAQERHRLSTINEVREALGMKKHPVDSIGALPADPGILSAEYQRYSATLTLDEARQCWVGLPALPDSKLGMTLLNPSLQAAQQGALNPQPEGGPGMGPDGPEGFGAGDDGGEGASEAPGGPSGPPQGFGGDVSDRLHALNGGGEDE